MSRSKPRKPAHGRPGRGPERSNRDYFVPGERAIRELLEAAPRRIRKLWLAPRHEETLGHLARSLGVPLEICPDDALRERAQGIDARGALALADPPAFAPFDVLLSRTLETPATPRVLVGLDGVLDPQNLGAILRNCEFFGATGVFWAKDRSAPLTPAAVRASVGASERLPMAQVTNFATALTEAKDAGLWVVGTVVDGGRELTQASVRDLPDPLVLVMGGEEKGLRRLTQERCDLLVTIGRRGALGSLNVAAATAAVLALLMATRT